MNAVILLANGFEEIEAVAPIDILRRAGVDVQLLAIGEERIVKGAHDISIAADARLKDVLNAAVNVVITPGGMPGSDNLKNSSLVCDYINWQLEEKAIIASICASPIVLQQAGVIKGNQFTCYPGFENQIDDGDFVDQRIVIDGQLITAKGPGVSFEFALAILNKLGLNQQAADIKEAMYIVE